MIALTQNELLQKIKEHLQMLFGERFRGLLLYGSAARGDAGPDSDIDVMCLLDGPDDGNALWKITQDLYALQLEIPDRELHVIPVNAKDFESGEFALFRIARKEGVPV